MSRNARKARWKLSGWLRNQLWVASSPSKLTVTDDNPAAINLACIFSSYSIPLVTIPKRNPLLTNALPHSAKSGRSKGSPPVMATITVLRG